MERVAHAARSAVDTAAANPAASPAKAPLVDMTRGRALPAGAFVYDGPALGTDWHRHAHHQLAYSTAGALGVSSRGARYLCPPHEALWIPAGIEHISWLGGARTISIFFAPELVPDLGFAGVRVLKATPLLREMVLYAARWPIDRTAGDALADQFFATMGSLMSDWAMSGGPWCLPESSHPTAARALELTLARLGDVTPQRVARAVGMSERSLRRLFANEVGISFSLYLSRARLMHAMALLATTDHSVLRVAGEVGFDSATSLSRALRRWTGATPAQYRSRTKSNS